MLRRFLVSTMWSVGATSVTSSVQRVPASPWLSALGMGPTVTGNVNRQAEGNPLVSSTPLARSTVFTWITGTPSRRHWRWNASIGATISRARGAGQGQSGPSSRCPRCMSMDTAAVTRGSSHSSNPSGIALRTP